MGGKEKTSQSSGKYRRYKGAVGKLVTALAVSMPLYHIFYLLGGFGPFGVYIPTAFHWALSLGYVLSLTFLVVPGTQGAPRDKLPWYDAVGLVVSLAGVLYFLVRYEHIMQRFIIATPAEIILASAFTLALLEATRRLTGLAIPILVLCFLFYGHLSNYFPSFLEGKGYPLDRLTRHLYLTSSGIFGEAMMIFATIIAAYVIFGNLLEASGGGQAFFDLGFSLVGRFTGGPAKAAVIGSGLFGTISGSAVANVVVDGTITIPMMMKTGFRKEVAAAIEATASTGGMIMPPVMGAAAFLMADFLQVSYWTVCIAAALPALLYYYALFLGVHFEAKSMGIRGLAKELTPSFIRSLLKAWPYLLAVALLIYLLGVRSYTPEKSVLYTLGVLMVITMLRKESRLSAKQIVACLERTAEGLLSIGAACGVIGIIIGVISLTGLGVKMSGGLVELSGGVLLVLLLLAAAASYILGMGLGSFAVYVLVAVLVAPALIKMGVLPMAAHMFVFYWAMTGMITPPVALAAYAAAAIVGANPVKTGFSAMRLGIVVLIVPFMFVYTPALLMIGSLHMIIYSAIIAIAGIGAFAVGLSGYLLGPMTWAERIFFIGAGILLVVPGWITDTIGAVLLLSMVLIHLIRTKRIKTIQGPPMP